MRINNYSRENYEKTDFDHLGTKLGEIIFIRGIFVDNKLLDIITAAADPIHPFNFLT